MNDIMIFNGQRAAPGEKVQAMVPIGDSSLSMPQTLINGARPGKTVLITGGIHGGEYPGIQTAIELAAELTPEEVSGQLVLLHPVNTAAFYQRVSYVNPIVGENLNRFYPGSPNGTPAEQIAWFFTTEYHRRADFLLDLHGGDLHEDLPPYVYYPGIAAPEVVEASRKAALLVHARYLVRSSAVTGAYNSCAAGGTPAILIERGSLGLWSPEEVAQYKQDVRSILKSLGVLEGSPQGPAAPAYEVSKASYLDAPCAGCWYPSVQVGDFVSEGQSLGVIRDFFGNLLTDIRADYGAYVLYMTRSLAVETGCPVITYGI